MKISDRVAGLLVQGLFLSIALAVIGVLVYMVVREERQPEVATVKVLEAKETTRVSHVPHTAMVSQGCDTKVLLGEQKLQVEGHKSCAALGIRAGETARLEIITVWYGNGPKTVEYRWPDAQSEQQEK